ncbi:cuticle protein 16.5-like [Sitodiplosis mosellana]|uniref:cuticle protein 16.5-like n=1 Tax=Sitodiplosis mosellana TaxID=263140 RepID=UPI0024439585|nr:cuticle protein 16.5-like [Sitodiplosis mosellana]
MKVLIVCMFALVATSMAAGSAKKEKRGVFGLGYGGFGGSSFGSAYSAPLATSYAAAPAIATTHQHTHSVERINVPQPYPVERTIVKTVGVDRPVPQPYPVPVVKHVPQPYPVERQVPQPYPVAVKYPVEHPVPVPYERVSTVIQKVGVPHPVAVDRPVAVPYPVPVHTAPAIKTISHAAPAFSSYAAPAYTSSYAAPAIINE